MNVHMRKFPRPALRAAVSFFIAVFPVFHGSIAGAASAPALLDRVVASVNDDLITWSEVHEAAVLDGTAADKKPEAEVLQDLIDRKLVVQQALKEGVRITNAEVRQAVDDIRNKYGMNEREFLAALKTQGISMERYKRRIAEELTISRYLYRIIRAKIVVPETDITKTLAEEGLTPEGVEEIRLRMIVLRTDSQRDKAAAMDLAEKIRSRAAGGEDFGDLARTYSDDPSADDGGDVGYIRKGTIQPEIEARAFAMEPGTVGAPFSVGDRVYILRLDGKRNNDAEYRKRRAEILKKKTDEVFTTRYRETINSLRRQASIELFSSNRELVKK